MSQLKPLESKESQIKKRHRNNVIIGIFVAAVMIFSTVGFAILEGYQGQQGEGQATYKNYKFTAIESGWQTSINIASQDVVLNTFYLPNEVENISSQGHPLLSEFSGKAIFIVADNDAERQAAYEYNAIYDLVLRMQMACSIEESNSSFCVEGNLPVKSCDDADYETKIIMLQESNSTNETSVNYKSSCLVIKGQGAELVKANEKALFMIFGIIG